MDEKSDRFRDMIKSPIIQSDLDQKYAHIDEFDKSIDFQKEINWHDEDQMDVILRQIVDKKRKQAQEQQNIAKKVGRVGGGHRVKKNVQDHMWMDEIAY